MTTSNRGSIPVRRAKPDDLAEILQLFEEAIRFACKKDYTAEQIEAWVASRENTARWEKAINQQYFLVAEIERQIAGFASLENSTYLDFMFVHPAYLGLGIAKELYQQIEKEARKQGSDLIYSNVSLTARSFFEKQGFLTVKTNCNQIRGVEIVNYRMEKKLTT